MSTMSESISTTSAQAWPSPNVNHVATTTNPRFVTTLRRCAGPAAVLTGPVLTVVGFSLHPKGTANDLDLITWTNAHPTQWQVAHVLIGVGLLLLAAGVGSALRLASGRGARLLAAGVVATVVGAASMGLEHLTHGAVGTALAARADVSPTLSLAIQKAFEVRSGPLSMLAIAFPLGVILLGIGALRSRQAPAWAAVLLVLGPVGISIAGAGPIELLGAAPLVIGFSALAITALQRGHESPGL